MLSGSTEPMAVIVAPGCRFGRLLVLSPAAPRGTSKTWTVRCDCGVIKDVYQQALRANTRSCGCWQREMSSKRLYKHGGCKGNKSSPEYATWSAMITRCHNPNAAGFSTHGARGIEVCDRWRHSFQNFLSDMGQRPSGKHSIDRINNNGNYEPGNCRWATSRQQMRNTRWNRTLVVNGERVCLTELAERIGVTHGTLRARLKKLSSEQAVAHPRNKRIGLKSGSRVVVFMERELSIKQFADEIGIGQQAMRERLKWMTPDEAARYTYRSKPRRKR